MAKANRPAEVAATENVVSEKQVCTATVVCEMLNVRKAPSLEAEIVAVISNGETVTVKDSASNAEWSKIVTNSGVKGFVVSKFIN